MRKIILSAIVAAFGFAGGAHAADGPGVGKWRWSAAESHYATGAYATEQTMEITRNDKDGIAVSQVVTPPDGKTFSWNIEAPYDNKMRKASAWMSFAFKRISANQFHDRYVMNDSGMRGEETFTITPDKITIRGASVTKGKKEPYVEVWSRVE
ncbi:MAG: hypothetical protein JWM91_3305 [Rhodospirillales bacterium]|nr:hypothetical protein [Rhodospirillales bacterium]